MRVDERGPVTRAAMIGGALERRVRNHGVSPVDFLEMKVRKRRDQPGNISPGGLHLNRNGDRVFVVLNREQHR